MQSKTKRTLNQLLGSLKVQDSKRLIVVETTHHYHNATTINLYVGDKTFEGLELPYKDNQRNISSIPRGTYAWQKIKRQSNGKDAIWLRDVPNRSEILIHEGRYPQHSKGCLLINGYENFHNYVESKGLIVLL
jgi:hypothetical protein